MNFVWVEVSYGGFNIYSPNNLSVHVHNTCTVYILDTVHVYSTSTCMCIEHYIAEEVVEERNPVHVYIFVEPYLTHYNVHVVGSDL